MKKTLLATALLLASSAASAEWYYNGSFAGTTTKDATFGYGCSDSSCNLLLWQDDLRCEKGSQVPALMSIRGEAIKEYAGAAHTLLHCVSSEPDSDGDYFQTFTPEGVTQETLAMMMSLGTEVRLVLPSQSGKFVAYTFSLIGSSGPVNQMLDEKSSGNSKTTL